MNTLKPLKTAILGMTLLAPALWSTPSLAGTASLTLTRSTLTNVDDAAGRWQYEGGTVTKGGTTVGQYAINRRITFGGTDTQNTAMETVTLFFTTTGSAAPNNITLEGAHNFSSGYFSGGVSAASNRYTWIQGANATIVPSATSGSSTLSINWNGASQLTLP